MNQVYIKFVVLYQFFAIVPNPGVISKVTTQPDKPPVAVPQIAHVYKKIAEIPQADFKPVSELATVPTPPSPTPASNTPAAAPTSGCGDNSYANYIYSHESGCSLTVRNAKGCLGIGQACPASKLLVVCPNLDYACENGFFTAYANAAYGGWAGAYNFWLAHHWW